jgi:hypothetical protein
MAARNAKKCSPGAIALVERVGGMDDVARIAPLTRPGIPVHMHPVIAFVTAGVEMDVLGIAYEEFPNAQREAVVAAYPRPPRFKEEIIEAFYDGIKDKPDTTFGNVKADVLADKDPHFHRGNFCSVIRGSRWKG